MADIDFELITPSAAEANDAVLVRRGASAPNSGALIAVSDLAAASHTHTAANITDFATAVAATAAVTANTAKVTNATHTGEVTGSTALTIAADAVTNAKLANMATSTIKGRVTASTGDPEDLSVAQVKTLLNLTGTNSGDQTITLTGDVTGSGTGSFAATVANDAVTYAKMQNVSAASKLLGRGDSGSGDVQEITLGANLTMTGTTLSASGGGGGSPGGSSGEVQYNNAGAFAGAADVEIEGGQLRLPGIATPTAPSAGGVKLFGRDFGGRFLPAIIGPMGVDTSLQPFLAGNKIGMFLPNGGSTTVTSWGIAYTTAGTATTSAFSTSSRYGYMRGIEYLVTVAATNAIASIRGATAQFTCGAPSAGNGGFHNVWRWGPATGVATSTTRAFAGMGMNGAPTDVEPSTQTHICGMGWDAADTNIQFMHNDGSGTATKIDLGASFPVPTVDRTSMYEVSTFSPPGTTQSVSYRVVDLVSGATASGTITTDLPGSSTGICPRLYMSVGGTSSVVGIKIVSNYIETDY